MGCLGARLALVVALGVAASAGCKRETPRTEPATAPAEKAPAPPAVDTPPAPTYRLAVGSRTKLDGEPPKLSVLSPKPDAVVDDDVHLDLKLSGWKLEPAPGAHLHVIVDDLPPIMVHDVSKPLALLPALKAMHGVALRPGRHFLRIFASRENHESVKAGMPFAYQVFHYKERINDKGTQKHAPLLTYSQPHGCYDVGERILLDFYLSNTEIGRYGHRVQITIDGTRPKAITKWVPHYIEGLTEGEHILRLVLVDADGQPMRGQLNDVTRKITVAKSCR